MNEPSPQAPTLVLVDDEQRILSALQRALRREGWRILATSDPDEALRWLDTEPVGAIVSDHRMPGWSGLQLLAEAARRQPGAARILITGWPGEISAEHMASLGIRALVPKPWDDASLRAVLREALGG